MYHNSFIHPSVEGHLLIGVLDLISSASMNTEVHVSFGVMVFSAYMPSSGTLAHGTSILFSTVIVSIYIPTNSVVGFLFLHTLSSIYCW